MANLRSLIAVVAVAVAILPASSEPVNVLDFGAVGDGVTDSTVAFQKAVDSLGTQGGRVDVPAGRYVVGEITLRPGVTVQGAAGFNFRSADAGTSIRLRKDATSRAMFDMTGAFGASLRDLAMVGCGASEKGRVVHGVALFKPNYGKQEDYLLVDHCSVRDFSGDGLHLHRVWCGNVRNCLIIANGGDGISLSGWDVFIINNEIAGNGGCGYHGVSPNNACTITANRVEWNRGGGLFLDKGSHYCITANYFDRSGIAGVRFEGAQHITFTGNQIYRSGKPEWARHDIPYSAHAVLSRCRGVTFSSNNFVIGHDDGGGLYSPKLGIVMTNLVECVVIGNTGSESVLERFIDDRGGHERSVIRDNVGSVFVPPSH